MRPISLKISAFGPFADTQFIDFRLLGEQPLFLINGVTGAGKTTILDAICFALYGKTTGDERDASQMRCDHAQEQILTYVELCFALKDQYYSIKRIPDQDRPKAKGEGYTKQNAQAELWLVDENSEQLKVIVSQKVTEATKEIELLTGLNVDQFRQVMVLPQGQFRKLLMADSKDREAIFSKLFSTSIYKRIENNLKEQALSLKREVGDLSRLKAGLLDAQQLGSLDELNVRVEQLSAQEKAAGLLKSEQQHRYLSATKTFEQAKTLHSAFLQVKEIAGQIGNLKTQQAHIVAVKDRTLRAEEAQKIGNAYQEKHHVEQQIPKLHSALSSSLVALESSQLHLDSCKKAQAQSPAIRQQLDTSKAQLIEYKRYSNAAVELSQLHLSKQGALAQLQKSQQNVTTTLAQVSKLKLEKQKITLNIENVNKQIEGAVDPAITLLDVEQKIQQLSAIATFRNNLTTVQALLEQLKISGAKVRATADEKKVAVSELEMQWHLSQAQRLAQQLQKDQPCPVCGSKEHPSIAASQEQKLVTLAQIDEAKKQAHQWETKLIKEREQYFDANAQFKSLTLQLNEAITQFNNESVKGHAEANSPSMELEFWHQARLKAQQAMTVLGDQKVHLQQAQKRMQVLSALEEEASALGQQQNHLLAEAEKTAAVNESEFSKCMASLPAAFQEAGALELAVDQNIQQQKQFESELELLAQRFVEAQGTQKAAMATHEMQDEALKHLKQKMHEVEALWQQALHNSFFNTEVEYLQATVEHEILKQLREEIRAYEINRKQLESLYQDQLKRIGNNLEPDLNALTLKLEQIKTQLDQQELAWSTIDKDLAGLLLTARQIALNSQQNEALEAKYSVIGTLSDVANGFSAEKVSLQRFVLSALLDDVLIEASHRLKIMSKGRYQLLRKSERAKGNKASGLELEVEDAYTGKVRSVATLSGGESFMAALALALGLSGIVQAYAGGIVLDTLFIDEGFGSLDAEALELAIRTLVDLQRTGRMIGVISHVAELKEQMPVRIDIIADQTGSHLRVIS